MSGWEEEGERAVVAPRDGHLPPHSEGGGGGGGFPPVFRQPPGLLCSHLATRGQSGECGPPPGQERRQAQSDGLLRPRHIQVSNKRLITG